MSPSPILYTDPATDLVNILTFCNAFVKDLGMQPVVVDPDALGGILRGLEGDFHNDGTAYASPFKKAANFVVYFIAERLVTGQLKVRESLRKIENHQNAIIAFEIARHSLHGATITRSDGVEVTLDKPIAVSEHSYDDIINALAKATPNQHFQLVAVLLEQLAYRANPDASYPCS